VGDNVSVRYTGVSWSTKKEFDSNWAEGREPFLIENVGPSAPVIAGWQEGLIGAKVGSRRQLIIPPGKGYGAQGRGPDIKGDETLVFVIDVLSIAKG
jgi:peptidylprolyl isomerase